MPETITTKMTLRLLNIVLLVCFVVAARGEERPLGLLPSAPVMSGDDHAKAVAKTLARTKSENDQWASETESEAISNRLSQLARAIESRVDLSNLSLVDPSFTTTGLRPPTHESFSKNGMVVQRQTDVSKFAKEQSSKVGYLKLQESLEGLFQENPDAIKVKFKVTGIQTSDSNESVFSEALYHASLKTKTSRTDQVSKWRCRWNRDTSEELRLISIEVSEFSEATATTTLPLFEDISEWAFDAQPGYQQLSKSVPYWQSRIQATLGQELFGHHGIAVGDINGDLLDDIYVCQPGGLPNRLFIKNSEGQATDMSAEFGLDLLDSTNSAAMVDFDNDEDQDLLALASHSLYFFENRGENNFSLVQTVPIDSKNAFSFSVADFDQDQLLDVYVCGYAYPTGKAQVPRPYHDSNNGYPNVLLKNMGGWKFQDVTVEVGLDQNNRRYSFSSAFEDFDNDGDLDLYVANDYGRNNLYRNQNGKFEDIAAQAGVEDISAGMAVTWADVNRDGWMDIHVSNMFSSAGNRVTYQRNFRESEDEKTKSLFQRHARGNSLFLNNGDGTFLDASVSAGITMGRWAWGARFLDLNNDGYEDLLVANGNITGKDEDDL